MQILSSEPLVLIGPGSEWFWTAISGLMLAITFLAIYRQLRAQRSANAFEQLTALAEEWTAERLTRKRLAVWISLRDGRDFSDVANEPSGAVMDFWERAAGLVRAGHVRLSVIEGMFGNSVEMWWHVLEPFTTKSRVAWAEPEIGIDFEWLAAHVAGSAGARLTSREFIRENLEQFIERQEAGLRDFEAMRTVVLAAPVTAPEVSRPRGTIPVGASSSPSEA